MSLQDRLDAFKADFEAGKPPYNAPPAVIAAMHRATRELIASGQAKNVKKMGDQAPPFALEDASGQRVSSSALLKEGPLVLSFYRGVWCPYCNMELKALEEALSDIKARGAHLVAISPQTPANSVKSQRENRLSFPILSDPGNEVGAAFGLRFAMPDYLIEFYKLAGIDLALVNKDNSWTLPMPARFVIDVNGIIVVSEVNPDYTKRPDPSELLPVLDRLAVRLTA